MAVSRWLAQGFGESFWAPLSAYLEKIGSNASGPPICYRYHHLRRQDIDILDMDDIRNSLSKLKKGFKHRVGGKKRAPDRAGDSTAGERANSSASLLRPDPLIAVSGHDGEGSRIGADASQALSRDPSTHPEPLPADEGRLDDPQKKEIDVGEKEAGQRHSSLDLDVEGAGGNGPGQEVERNSSPPPVTSIPRGQEPDSAWTLSPRLLCLIIPLGNDDTLAAGDPTPQELCSDENAEPGVGANEKKLDWKTTAFATAKLLLRGVRDSADAFGPLKSVAGGLCFILENCEVWFLPHVPPRFSQVP